MAVSGSTGAEDAAFWAITRSGSGSSSLPHLSTSKRRIHRPMPAYIRSLVKTETTTAMTRNSSSAGAKWPMIAPMMSRR